MRMRLALSFLAAFLAALAADIWLVSDEGRSELWGGHVWAYFALFGFVFCVLMIVVAKLLGHYLLQRHEDYYGGDEGDE